LLAASLSAVVLAGASVLLILHLFKQAEVAQVAISGERYRVRLEQVLGQLRQAVDRLQAQPLRTCTVPMRKALEQVGHDYRFVFDAALIEGEAVCSNRLGAEQVDFTRAPDVSGPLYRYWLDTSAEPDNDLATLMLGRDDFRVSTSRGHLSDVIDLPPGGSLLVVTDAAQRAVPVIGPAQPWPPSQALPDGDGKALSVTPTHYIFRMDALAADVQPVLIVPRLAWWPPLSSALWLLLPFSLLLALCIGGLVGQWARQRLSLSGKLQGALRRQELQVLYQPIVDLHSRRCVGAEALLRWHSADGSLTSPDMFIPMAEDTGQIRQLTDFVIEQSLVQLGSLLRANPHLYVSVNLAACDVVEPRVRDVAAALLQQHGVAARQMAFEITERGLIDVAPARDNLHLLRDAGHPILIDDFGTGYCSLAYLQTLPVDCLKIDKVFVGALGHDAASSGVAPHIIRMAHALKLRVVAEGIENQAQVDLLTSEGVRYGQGWLFAQALDAGQFRELITQGRRRTGGRRREDSA